MPKLTSDAYAFVVVGDFDMGKAAIGPIRTVLIQTATGRRKEFFQAVGSVDRMMEHMETLTDDQCDAWFPCPECGAQMGRPHKKNCSQRDGRGPL